MKARLEEKQLRKRLGIPLDAETVLIFAESSHWDPNWLYTTEEYFRNHIKKILDKALFELKKEPKRIYSIECIFFLKMYWDRCPDKRKAIRSLVNQGRIRLTGSGLTTPDTTLPETEALLRDYLKGWVWLRENRMTQIPRVAYFPDGFGHSPGVPSILRATGYEYTAISRIDGMNFPGTDYRSKWYYPRPSSNAWLLLRELKTLDFFWRSPDGSKVLCHWNSFTYFQGDNIVYVGPIKWMGTLYGYTKRSESHVEKRILEFVKQLEPLSRTPYLFCPIGMDFNPPITGLHGLIKRYNRMSYPETGIYAVLAGLDDYMDLVFCHKDRLPALELDFNPYWMGFYTSRPRLKQRCKNLTKDLIKAEKFSLLARENSKTTGNPFKSQDLTSAWDALILSNHHDFITGTSPDRVYIKEQKTLLVNAREIAKKALAHALRACPRPPMSKRATLPKLTLRKQRLVVDSPYYTIELDESRGGCLTKWADKTTGENLLAGLGNDIVLYEDSGGLWRMGHEFRGGVLRVLDRISRRKATIHVREVKNILQMEVRSKLKGKDIARHLWFRGDSPIVRMKVTGSLGIRRTATVRFSTLLSPRSLFMDVPGGIIERPPQKIFEPTFWAAKSFVHVKEQPSDRGVAIALYGPACLSGSANGVVEWVAMRNAPKETAFKFLPIMAHPASGYEPGEQILDYAVWLTPKGNWQENGVRILAEKVLRTSWLRPGEPCPDSLADSLATVDNETVRVGAVKPADIGGGIIVRLFSFGKHKLKLALKYRGKNIKKAWLCDALEHNIKELAVKKGKAVIPMDKHMQSVRIHL